MLHKNVESMLFHLQTESVGVCKGASMRSKVPWKGCSNNSILVFYSTSTDSVKV